MEQKLTQSHLPDELSEFVSADFPPQDGYPVLCIRRSSSIHSKYELLTARYVPDYSMAKWRDLDGNSVLDSGYPILGWKQARRWLGAR